MQTHIATTPFGRRPMSLGLMASQIAATKAPEGAVVDKWKVFRFIREAKEPLGATDRALAILNALLSFHPGGELSSDGALIVFPSNEQLVARANGMPPATLRRHLAVLVDCGLIIRRDSPNGKRFARRSRAGEIEQAYGFDLSPIIARAQEFEELAEAVLAEKKAFKVVKERLTLLRRDIVKMIDAAIEESVPGNWGRITELYRGIIARLPRTAPRQVLEAIADDLQYLWTDIRDILETFTNSQNHSANESHSERHIQNSNPDSNFDSEYSFRKKEEAGSAARETDNLHSLPKRDLPLGMVLNACPDLRELAQGGEIRTWRDFLAAAELARASLGVSPSAWREACEVMGEGQAAITVAAILQRAGEISSHGGYLRSLTDRARDGKFSTWPMIMALLNARMERDKATVRDGDSTSGEFQVSSALAESLKRPRR